MSKETENVFKEFDKFMADKNVNSSDDFKKMVSQFMSQYNEIDFDEITEENAETSDDFLELAHNATSKKNALKFAKKALELDPENIDAETLVAEISAKTIYALEDKYKKIIEKATNNLTRKGYFDEENIGEFWLILETRPYMRLCDKYIDLLVNTSKMKLATAECEKMIWLCENDNLGERYRLMHLYAFLEDEESALELLKKYPEDSTQFLLPMSILYYKLGNSKEAVKYLKKLNAVNKDTYEFLELMINENITDYFDEISPYGYKPFTIQEFIVEVEVNNFLFASIPAYYEWALGKLKK